MFSNNVLVAALFASFTGSALANPAGAPPTCGQLQMWSYQQGTSNICGPFPAAPPYFNQPSGPNGCQQVPAQTSVMWLQSWNGNANIEWFYDAACTVPNLAGSKLTNKCVGSFDDQQNNHGKGWFYKITC